jgi:hypothetical protein
LVTQEVRGLAGTTQYEALQEDMRGELINVMTAVACCRLNLSGAIDALSLDQLAAAVVAEKLWETMSVLSDIQERFLPDVRVGGLAQLAIQTTLKIGQKVSAAAEQAVS